MMAYREWSTTERRMVFEMRENGGTLAEMAKMTGRSVKAVCNFIKRQNLPVRPYVRKPVVDWEPEEAIASRALLEAMNASYARFANDNRMTPEEARSLLLGREPCANVIRIRPTATDHTGYSPFEVRRAG